MREPKFNIGDEVKVKSLNPKMYPDFYAFVKGYEYYGKEFGEDEKLTGYDYEVAYQLEDGTWEQERYSEDYLK